MSPQEQDELLQLHNQNRMSGWRPLGELEIDPLLTRAAQSHADYMQRVSRMSHTGENRSSVSSRVAATGYAYSRADENIARGQTTAVMVMRSWMRSRGHRNNIRGSYRHVGFGRAGNYWCVVFASPRARSEQ
jgi:uncharacterized protein YkwD